MITVALVDWNWMGHHPMYFRILLKGFRSCGVKVLAVCTEVAIAETKEWLGNEPDSEALLDGVDFISVRHYGVLMRLPGFIRGWEHGRRMFGKLSNNIQRWENQSGNTVKLVFFATIYDHQFENFYYAQRFFNFPWSGIYLHARAFRLPGTKSPGWGTKTCPEKIFPLNGMSSICMLDEGVIGPMQKLCGDKPVFEFPDITDRSVDTDLNESSLPSKIKHFAAGRKIVVCLGHLQKTKGLLEICKAVGDPRMRNVCFFFGGEVNWADMSREEIVIIQDTLERAPNVLTHLTRIRKDATMNSIILAADIVFAAYTNFPNSSNIMTKAACFERPTIVSDGFLMAERVRLYEIGRIVPEGDVSAIITAIAGLISNPILSSEGFKHYSQKHSEQALLTVLESVLHECDANER